MSYGISLFNEAGKDLAATPNNFFALQTIDTINYPLGQWQTFNYTLGPGETLEVVQSLNSTIVPNNIRSSTLHFMGDYQISGGQFRMYVIGASAGADEGNSFRSTVGTVTVYKKGSL